MKKFFVCIAVAALALVSGCTLTQQSIDSAIQSNLPKVCSIASTAHSAFLIVASASNKIPASVVNDELAAWQGMEVICNDPSSVNSSTALVTAAQMYSAITKSLAAAKAAGA